MWYLVLSKRVRSNAEMEPRTPAHRDWLDDHHRAGRFLLSGASTDGGYGIYIVLADSLEEAKAIAGQDPYHVHGDREMQVLEWRAHRAMRLAGPSIEQIEAIARDPEQSIFSA
jgi:uncharacterized protein YciI